MRKQFFIPVMVGMLALSAAQAFAQSGTVVMRNGDRVQAEVRDMGQNFSLRVNGQPRQVPIGDIVLIDFTGNGRDISNDELSRANAANGYIVMKNGETFNASLKDLTGTRSLRSSRTGAARISARCRASISARSTTCRGSRSAIRRSRRRMREDRVGAAGAAVAIVRRIARRACQRPLGGRAVQRAVDQRRLQREPRSVPAVRAVRRDSVEHQWRGRRARGWGD